VPWKNSFIHRINYNVIVITSTYPLRYCASELISVTKQSHCVLKLNT